MPKFIKMLSVFGIALIIGCAEPQQAEEKPAEPAKEDITTNPDYKKGLALVATSNCLTCHAVNQTTTGPAYADIAAKYAGADEAKITELARKIIEGGVGVWGQVPMIPHPEVSEEDAKAMVKYVLLLNKK